MHHGAQSRNHKSIESQYMPGARNAIVALNIYSYSNATKVIPNNFLRNAIRGCTEPIRVFSANICAPNIDLTYTHFEEGAFNLQIYYKPSGNRRVPFELLVKYIRPSS